MIKSVEIKNFQSHKDSKIDLSNGLNVIIGSGDNGKSAVLKAILWVLTNKPDGDEFISHWAKKKEDCVVTLYTERGYVTRCKGKTNNYYDVNGSKLTAFGKAVPEEVTEFFNLSELNWQGQFDSHFLLTDSNADVSKKFNEISNLDIIDTTLSNANSYIREMKSKEKHIDEDVVRIKEELKSYEGLEQLKEEIDILNKTSSQIDLLSSNIDSLNSILHSLDETSIKVDALVDAISNEAVMKQIEAVGADLTSITTTFNNLSSLIDSIKSARMKLLSSSKAIKNSEDVITELESLHNDFSQISEKQTNFSNLITKIHTISENITVLENELPEKEKEYRDLLGDVCPVCGSTL